MKKLLSLLNSYPGVNLDEKNFVFSVPVYIPHQKMDVVTVRSKKNSNTYIDKDFFYRRFNLDEFNERNFQVNVSNEKTTHDLIYRLSKVAVFPYQEGTPTNDQDKNAVLEANDIVNEPLPTISAEGTVIVITAKPQSYYFRGSLQVTLKKIPFQEGITKIEIVPDLMIK